MNNLKRNAILVVLLFISAFLVASLTQRFRFVPDFRWLYLTGVFLCYTFHLIAFLYSLIFLIYLLKKDVNLKVKYNWIWVTLSLMPFILYLLMFVIIAFEVA